MAPAIVWSRLNVTRAATMLHSPRYAGAYAYGRGRSRKRLQGGSHTEKLPMEQWHTLIFDAHIGYVSWAQFERNQVTLATNATHLQGEKHTGIPREGPALLQGLALCGKCGRRMVVRYQYRKNKQENTPVYCCILGAAEFGDPPCQTMPGATIDAAISELVIAAMSPMACQISLSIQAELQARLDQTERLRGQQVERAQYEVELARRRYMAVDATNRLVASTLEAEWNNRLADLDRTRADAERQRLADNERMNDQTRERILALSRDFPAVWHDAATPDRERKRMLALLIEDVTLTRLGARIAVGVRFRGGATTQLDLPVPKSAFGLRATHPEAMALIRQWANELKQQDIAERLNVQGYLSGTGQPFTASKVQYLIFTGRMGKVIQRPLCNGHLNATQMVQMLGRSLTTVKNLRRKGLLRAEQYNSGQWAYLPLAEQPEPIRLRAEKQAKLAVGGQSITSIG